MSDKKETNVPEKIEFNNWHPAKFNILASQATDYGRAYRIGIFAHTDNGVYAASKIELEKIADEDHSAFIPDAITMDKEQAQKLMDSLWDTGIRPNESKLKKLQVGALEHHLSDMKKLVFDYLMPKVMEMKSEGIDKAEFQTMIFETLKDFQENHVG